MDFGQKFGSYLVSIVILSVLNQIPASILGSAAGFIGLAVLLGVLAVNFYMAYAIYEDAPQRGLSENWWLIMILGPLGAIIYFILR